MNYLKPIPQKQMLMLCIAFFISITTFSQDTENANLGVFAFEEEIIDENSEDNIEDNQQNTCFDKLKNFVGLK